jgi:cytochrome c556
MNIASRLGTLALVGSLIAACRASSAEPAARQPPVHHEAAVPANAMDSRTPVPLTAMMATHQKQEMRDHLRVVQEVVAALGKDDFEMIAKSATRIGWSEQQAAMCKHMGAGAPGFAEVGEHFHKTADQITEAARRNDRAGVVTALGATLQTCTGCHETYRQEIVDAATLDKASGGMAPSCPMMHAK